ncbi:hypothetical protein [Arenimonas caeni]|jgi:hypothetical protein|uniref:hypothetical protein n=1 Tax=Arenimonas caeni TaxID=2058085 RepID=UPI002A3600A9|nr:hypothetical protein [Arenimonas caeni]MDY0023078.1 hypothetical protein [Arenimonas caeni]
MKKLVWLVVLVAVVVGAKEFLSGGGSLPGMSPPRFENPYPASSPLHAQHQDFIDRANADEKLRKRFAGIMTSKGLFAELKLALARGAQSLEGPMVVSATRAMAAVIPRLPERSCAKLMRPRDDFDPELERDVRAAFERLPPRHHKNFLEFYLRALQAEVHDAPRVARDPAARERALVHLGEAYPGVFGQRLAGVLRDPLRASDEDACWAINSMTHTSTQLDPESAEALSRLLWGGEG